MIKLGIIALSIVACLIPEILRADIVIATRTIRAQSVILPGDLTVAEGDLIGAAQDPGQVIGQEARIAIYAGRPVRLNDIGPPAVIQRNQLVPLVFQKNGLHITAEGRSLSRASPGERVRVMNLSSRTTVSGWVAPDGTVFVAN
ncbi:MAG: flagellar basal body P-ring formation chaperone FlgA [Pseudomonadota bacterium]